MCGGGKGESEEDGFFCVLIIGSKRGVVGGLLHTDTMFRVNVLCGGGCDSGLDGFGGKRVAAFAC